MTLQSLIHATVTTVFSPSKPSVPLENDYEIEEEEESLHAISNHIISRRKQSTTLSTPTRSTRPIESPGSRGSPVRNGSIKLAPPATTTNASEMTNGYDERDKIRQFVNVKQMLTSLRNLVSLITDEDIDFTKFKKTYVESSLGLLESIQDKANLQYEPVRLVEYTGQQQRDFVVKIGLVSVQIFVVLIDLLTPVLIQTTVLWRQIMNNTLVQKVLNVVVELILVILTLILDYLKKCQNKSKRQTNTSRANRANTRYRF